MFRYMYTLRPIVRHHVWKRCYCRMFISVMQYRAGGVIWTKNPQWKMGSGPGSPFALEDKAPWTSWMFNFGGFTDSPHPHKQDTRGLDTIKATSFFPWWILLSRTFWGKGRFIKKIPKSGKILGNHRPDRDIHLHIGLILQIRTFEMSMCFKEKCNHLPSQFI